MPENNSDFDQLLAQAQEEIDAAQRAEEEKKQEQEAKIVQLISDLDMRWNTIKDSKNIIGVTKDLLNTPESQKDKNEELESQVRKAKNLLEKKEIAVQEILENDDLSEDMKLEISKSWEEEKKVLQTSVDEAVSSNNVHQGEMNKTREKYFEAGDFQKRFQARYPSYGSSINGKVLFQQLLTSRGDDEWLLENLLTDAEKEFVEQLSKEQAWEKGEMKLKERDDLFAKAKKQTKERVTHEIDTRLEKTLGAKELLEELFLVEGEDKEVFEAAKKYIIDTIGEGVWGDLVKSAKTAVETSKEDIDAWESQKKGFGKNTSANRKKRLIDTAEPLRTKRKDVYDKGWVESRKMSDFLYELKESKYGFQEGTTDILKMKDWEKGDYELQEVARHIYELSSTNKIFDKINALENATFLDADQEHAAMKKLGELKEYLLKERDIAIKNLSEIVREKQKSLNEESGKISKELDKFPITPTGYYSKEEKED